MPVASMQHRSITWLAPGALLLVVVAGAGTLFATYWDDAWHTDLGRDTATIPPHLLLYGSVAVIGVVVVAWGLAALQRRRSLLAVLRQPPLLLAATGATVTLATAPIDAAWHAAFGRDAVLWSPPHLLGVFGTLALIVGTLAGTRPGTHPWIPAAAGALLLGSAVMPVLEFETDVPQFSEALYLPVLLAGGLLAAAVLRLVVPGPVPVVRAVGIYVLLRVAITIGLAGLGRSTPDLPLAILGLASVAAGAVAVVAVPALVVFAAVLLAAAGWLPRLGGAALLLLLGVTVALLPRPAAAHDPGQGDPVAAVTLTGASDGRGTLAISAGIADACAALTPARVVARRAGHTLTGALTATGRCRYAGKVSVTPAGRWFLYVQLREAGRVVEAWLPVDASRASRLVQRRELY